MYYLFFFFQAEDGIRDRSPSRGLGEKGKPPHSVELGQYLIIYDNVDPSVIYCFVAVPEMIDSVSYSFSLDYYVFINTENGLRCSVTKERPITTCGLVTDELEPYVAMSSERLDKKMYVEHRCDYSLLYCYQDTYDDIINNGLSDEEYNEMIGKLCNYQIPCTDETINSELRELVNNDKEFLDKSMDHYLPNVVGVYEGDILRVGIVKIGILDCYPQEYRFELKLYSVQKTDNGYSFIKE